MLDKYYRASESTFKDPGKWISKYIKVSRDIIIGMNTSTTFDFHQRFLQLVVSVAFWPDVIR